MGRRSLFLKVFLGFEQLASMVIELLDSFYRFRVNTGLRGGGSKHTQVCDFFPLCNIVLTRSRLDFAIMTGKKPFAVFYNVR